ncbi:MAG TPA: OmpH family outer membrane protein [Cytophagaceae bacterium]|nr:OmpH family outer membrane protein [Cytophagaceae bacterium]
MKNKVTILLFALVAGFIFSAEAQHLKIGYADPNYIMENMPDTKKIQAELQVYEKQLQNQLQAKYKDYQEKGAALEQGGSMMAPSVKEDKVKELTFLEQSIKDFEQKAQEDLQKKQMVLVDPLLDKIQKAINAIAEEHGYTYIFSTAAQYGGSSIILFTKNKNENISDLVLIKLGVTPPVPGTGTTTPTHTGTNTTNINNTNTTNTNTTAPKK